MNVCVLIPVYNEGKTIGAVVKAAASKGLTVVVVDDGSTDDSFNQAAKSGAVVIKHPSRTGKGFTLRSGFDFALKNRFDGVIIMDGDGQHEAGDLDTFLHHIGDGDPGMIVGNRMVYPKDMPWIRLMTNRFMSAIISWGCGQKVPDSQCGYRYIKSDVLRKIDLISKNYELDTEILMKVSRKGFKIISIPVKSIYSDEKSKINPVVDTIRFIIFFVRQICNPRD